MKYILLMLLALSIYWNNISIASTSLYWNTPEQTLDGVVNNAKTNIIESKFDNVVNKGTFGEDRKISWTLDSVRDNISFYLNWILFFGLSWATILIVYNGFLLVLTPMAWDKLENTKTRLLHLIIWVVVMTWFYFVIKIVLSIMNMILE